MPAVRVYGCTGTLVNYKQTAVELKRERLSRLREEDAASVCGYAGTPRANVKGSSVRPSIPAAEHHHFALRPPLHAGPQNRREVWVADGEHVAAAVLHAAAQQLPCPGPGTYCVPSDGLIVLPICHGDTVVWSVVCVCVRVRVCTLGGADKAKAASLIDTGCSTAPPA